MLRAFLCCVLALAGTPVVVAGQRAVRPGLREFQIALPASIGLTGTRELPELADLMPSVTKYRQQRSVAAAKGVPDYRWEGLAIGPLVIGAVGAVALNGTCPPSDSCVGPTVGGALMGALVGAVTGGLIGGAIPKGSPPE